MSTSKAEKEKLQLIQEKSQQILSELLKDEDNKYCVDCDAKGPRWASWNLGVFLCIRCAGIHRNLGVHISRVKSVNLDSWSPEQVAYMQLMGNSKARAVYEANLPDGFKRPQADSSLEAFVRSKYEHKKFIAKEWVQPAAPKPAFDIEEERKKDKEKKRNKIVKGQTNSAIIEVQTNPVPRPHSSPAGTAINAEKVLTTASKNTSNGVKPPLSADLLDLNLNSTKSNQTNDDDQFDAFVSCAPLASSKASSDLVGSQSNATTTTISETNEEEDFFNQKAPEQKKLDKQSILKLYSSNNHSQPSNGLLNFNTIPVPLQPMNLQSAPTPPNTLINGFHQNNAANSIGGNLIANSSNGNHLANNLFNNSSPLNVINNGFTDLSNQSATFNQQNNFLAAFNQTANATPFSALSVNSNLAAVPMQPTTFNLDSNNPFLNEPSHSDPVPFASTNSTTSSLINSTDLFSSNGNTNLSAATTTLESQLNNLNLGKAPVSEATTLNWPSSMSSASVGQSLFSVDFDKLSSNKSTATTNPFVATTNQSGQAPESNLDLFAAFNDASLSSSSTNAFGTSKNTDLNDLEGWSNFHTATTATTTSSSGLAADFWP